MGTQTCTTPPPRDAVARSRPGPAPRRAHRLLSRLAVRRALPGLVRLLLALALALPAGLVSQGVRPALAAAGDLDPTFGTGGKVITDFGGADAGRAIAVQADGKVVVAGSTDLGENFALARYLPSGALDPTFGNGGRVTTDIAFHDGAKALVVQPDGKLVAAGGDDGGGFFGLGFKLVRYLPNGSLDSSFGVGGKVLTDFGGGRPQLNALALQADGKIVAAGRLQISALSSGWALARYHPNGSLDQGFGDGGKILLSPPWPGTLRLFMTAFAVTVQADGKIVATGEATAVGLALARFNPDGSLDAGFGSGGGVVVPVPGEFSAAQGRAVLVQPNGKIVVAGGCLASFCLVRLNQDGTPDAGFGNGGVAVTEFDGGVAEAYALALQADGKLVASGLLDRNPGPHDVALARYNPDGSPDPGFGDGGKVITDFGLEEAAFAVAVQADGKVVIAGVRSEGGLGSPPSPGDFVLARYLGGGAGGTGLGISPEAARNRLSWTGGGDQLGYLVARDPDASAVLPAGATAYTDVAPAPPPTLNCYVLVPFGPAGPLGVSDALCARQGLASPVGAPQGFTLRLNQSSTASLSWVNTFGTVGSVLVALPLDGSPPRYQPLAAGTTTATDATGGAFTCYMLVAGTPFGQFNTDLACGLPGVSTLGTSTATAAAPPPRTAGTGRARAATPQSGTAGTEQARAVAEQRLKQERERIRLRIQQLGPKLQEALQEARQRLTRAPLR